MTAFLVFLGILGLWFTTASLFEKYDSRNSYVTSMGGACIFLVVSMVFFAFANIFNYYWHISDLESLAIIDTKIEVYETRADQLTEDLKIVLVDNYGNHEKEIFSNMGGDNLSLLLIKYPELRASETFIEYSKQIRELNDDKYKKELDKIDIIQSINTRKRNPFVFGFILPNE